MNIQEGSTWATEHLIPFGGWTFYSWCYFRYVSSSQPQRIRVIPQRFEVVLAFLDSLGFI